jgi:hypothetical protein
MTDRWPCILLLLTSLGSLTGLPVDALAQGQDSSILAHYLSDGHTDLTAEALAPDLGSRSLIRRDFDLTGDGVPEVFLSEKGMGSRAEGWPWQVYDGSDPARFRYLGTVKFHEYHVRVTAPGELRALHQGGSLSRIWVVDYRWTGSDIVEVGRILLEDGPELTAEQLETKRFQERLPEWAPWAEVTSEGLGPWIDPSTEKPVRDLVPIVSQRFTVSAAARVGPPSLLEDLGERLRCPQKSCELLVEIADLTADGKPELLFNSSESARPPRPVYAEAAGGYRYLGDLPMGAWRLDDQGRASVVKSSPPALARYLLTSEEMVFLEELTLETGRTAIDQERQAIFAEHAIRDRGETIFRVPWREAAGTPENPPWLTFKTREPAEIEVDLSLPVVNAETGGEP